MSAVKEVKEKRQLFDVGLERGQRGKTNVQQESWNESKGRSESLTRVMKETGASSTCSMRIVRRLKGKKRRFNRSNEWSERSEYPTWALETINGKRSMLDGG